MNEVGQRLRELRKQKGLSIKALAEQTELSSSFISQVERGVSSVSFASLHSFCRALGVSLAEFFGESDPTHAVELPASPEQSLVHSRELEASITLSDAAINYRFLSTGFPARQFEAMMGTISPGYSFPPSTHKGEEFGHVLEGTLKLIIGEDTYVLGPGDSYHFSSTIPHGYGVEGDHPVRVLWVVTVNRFVSRSGVRITRSEEGGSEADPTR